MIPPALGRFIRYWYTYRTVVAVLLGILVSGSMYWLYTQQVACDNQDPSCAIRLSLHPEDRLFFESSDPNIVLVGIDDHHEGFTAGRHAGHVLQLSNAGARAKKISTEWRNANVLRKSASQID